MKWFMPDSPEDERKAYVPEVEAPNSFSEIGIFSEFPSGAVVRREMITEEWESHHPRCCE